MTQITMTQLWVVVAALGIIVLLVFVWRRLKPRMQKAIFNAETFEAIDKHVMFEFNEAKILLEEALKKGYDVNTMRKETKTQVSARLLDVFLFQAGLASSDRGKYRPGAFECYLDCMSVLLDNGADVNLPTDNGFSPMDKALFSCKVDKEKWNRTELKLVITLFLCYGGLPTDAFLQGGVPRLYSEVLAELPEEIQRAHLEAMRRRHPWLTIQLRGVSECGAPGNTPPP